MTIRLMRAIEVPATPRDQVFRSSRLHAVLFVLFCISLCAAMIRFAWPTQRLAYSISAVIVVLLLLMHGYFTTRFHRSNWLVRAGDEGLFIHFRSYLNEHLSAEDPTVVYLPYQDIRSARLVTEHTKTRGTDGAMESQSRRYVELELAIDPAPLAVALAVECARPGVWEKRWYGRSASLYQDYPVLMQSPPFLRIEWKAAPRASAFLDVLRPRVEVAPPVVVSEDFADLQGLTREQQQKRIHDLDQRGQTIAAVYLASRLYALDLTRATEFVKGLRGAPQA
jgi:hypothetical protein